MHRRAEKRIFYIGFWQNVKETEYHLLVKKEKKTNVRTCYITIVDDTGPSKAII